ncbi:hypothetical protein PR202_gb15783 [Eleusine coracana subsp. coracana]|uniref:Uncharacterized protein n=1 Tax=Eleusine coracana subsp. coracana TaxID=191504 RepID=A0AAV5EY28_ELECO|nr:hypothetical protein PR202_gb15783 [Eleusine coracana subsp. coracana]
MAQHIYATTTSSGGHHHHHHCARPAIPLRPAAPTPRSLPLRFLTTNSSRLPRRMGASDHLMGVAVAAMPRNGNADPRRPCPCGAVLGESLAAEAAPGDDDLLVHPSAEFAAQALVSSTQQVVARRNLSLHLNLHFSILSPFVSDMGGAC